MARVGERVGASPAGGRQRADVSRASRRLRASVGRPLGRESRGCIRFPLVGWRAGHCALGERRAFRLARGYAIVLLWAPWGRVPPLVGLYRAAPIRVPARFAPLSLRSKCFACLAGWEVGPSRLVCVAPRAVGWRVPIGWSEQVRVLGACSIVGIRAAFRTSSPGRTRILEASPWVSLLGSRRRARGVPGSAYLSRTIAEGSGSAGGVVAATAACCRSAVGG